MFCSMQSQSAIFAWSKIIAICWLLNLIIHQGVSSIKYVNAGIVLPDSLVKELQKYIQGEYLYIPMKKEQHKKWGQLSGYRAEILQRNKDIAQKYTSGASIEQLADSYCLSVYTIKKIIYTK